LLAPCRQQQQQQQQHVLGPASLPPLPTLPNFTASPSFGPANSGDIVWPWFDEGAQDLPLLEAPALDKLLAPTPPGSRPPSPARPPWPDNGSRPLSPARPKRPDSRPPSPPRPREGQEMLPMLCLAEHGYSLRPTSPCRSERDASPCPEHTHASPSPEHTRAARAVPETPPRRPVAAGTLVRTHAETSSAIVEAELMHSVLGRLYAQLVQAASGGLVQQWAGAFDALVAELMHGGGCRDIAMLAQQEASIEIDLTREIYPSNRVEHMQHTSATL